MTIVFLAMSIASFSAITAREPEDVSSTSETVQSWFPIIPWPSNIKPGEAKFVIDAETAILADASSNPNAKMLAETMRISTGFKLPVLRAVW